MGPEILCFLQTNELPGDTSIAVPKTTLGVANVEMQDCLLGDVFEIWETFLVLGVIKTLGSINPPCGAIDGPMR